MLDAYNTSGFQVYLIPVVHSYRSYKVRHGRKVECGRT